MTSAKPSTRRVERDDVLLWLLAGIPVVAWIVAQQLGFLATRSLCTNGHRWVLYLVMAPTLSAAAAAGVVSWMKWRAFASKSAEGIPTYRPFMALVSVLLAAICALSIFSLMIPAALDRLCG